MEVLGTVKFFVAIILIVGTLKEKRFLLITYLTFALIGLVMDFAYFFQISGRYGAQVAYDVTAFLISIYGFVVVYSFQSELESAESVESREPLINE